MKTPFLILAPCLLALAACGETKQDRAVSGGLIGAGAGAVIGSTVGAPVTGAVVGGSVGAATGALADPNDLNFGKPIWR